MSGKKKILLITTTHTGCGHKSISDALMDWFVDMPEVEVKQVDGFEDLVGKSVTALGDSYGVVTAACQVPLENDVGLWHAPL